MKCVVFGLKDWYYFRFNLTTVGYIKNYYIHQNWPKYHAYNSYRQENWPNYHAHNPKTQ